MTVATWEPEASPQEPAVALSQPSYPSIVLSARVQGITSIVHFTRTRGLTGILSSGLVKARRYLPSDDRLKHVYEENAADRSRDVAWHGYINLSISAINRRMFNFSKREHPDDEWVILEFSPEILGHPGVVFCTTNNVYPVAHRAAGPAGFEQMFAPSVPWGHYGSECTRHHKELHQTTDPQAEVLYPFELALDHLHTITVGDEDTLETTEAALVHFPYRPRIVLNPEAF